MKNSNKKPMRAAKKQPNNAATDASSDPKALLAKPKQSPIPASKATKLVVLNTEQGLSFEQWKTLHKKDPNRLTPLQLRQLEEANKSAAEMVKRFGEIYDFSLMVKSVWTPQVLPIIRLGEEVQNATKMIEALSKSIAIPTQSLVAFQKSLLITSERFNKSIAEIANASLAARSMFDDFQSFHTRVVKSLSIDIASLGRSSQFSVSEAVELDVQTVAEQDGHIIVKGETNQVRKISGYVLVHQADLNFLFTEIKATRSELSDFKNLIGTGVQNGISKIAYADATFRRGASRLILKGFHVFVQQSSKQARFCDLFFSSPESFVKKWDVKELALEAFGWRLGADGSEVQILTKVKHYINALNMKIAAATKGHFPNFFMLVGFEIFINPEYLSSL